MYFAETTIIPTPMMNRNISLGRSFLIVEYAKYRPIIEAILIIYNIMILFQSLRISFFIKTSFFIKLVHNGLVYE